MALKLVPAGTNINFMRFRKMAGVLSVLFLISAMAMIFTKGLNLGIDFTGGTLVQVQTSKVADVGQLRNALAQTELTGATIQSYGSEQEFLIRTPAKVSGDVAVLQATILGALEETVGQADIRRVEFVGPQIGEELRKKGLIAMLCALGAILLYISMRFEFRYGVGAIAALSHDLILTLGVFELTQREISLPVLAALLTVIGYSLNDTIVVFDRIREVRERFVKKPIFEAMNMALNQTLNRTLMTSLTTALVLVSLYFLGGSVINDFAFTLLFGVVVGTYSSIFIAAPVLALFEKRYQKIYAERDAEEAIEKP